MPALASKVKPFFVALLILTAFSCEKDRGVIETQLVVTKSSRNIPTDYNIVNFDTYDENHIFAIGMFQGSVGLFLSSNGGTSWMDITSTFNPAWNQSIEAVKSIVYMDESNLAFVADNRLYRSYDGGQNWTITTNGFQELPIFFAGKGDDGKLLFIEDYNSTWYVSKIYKSDYASSTFYTVDTLPPAVSYYDVGRLYGNYLMLLDYENDYHYSCVHGFDLLTGEYETIPISATGYDYPLDAMRVGNRVFLIRKEGKVNFQSLTDTFTDYSFYNFHSRDYYSGEYMGNYYIAVGDQTISTNINGKWEEALNTDLSGQQEVFRKVKKIAGDYFYVSGDKGLFFKGTFK
ncbi:hypothetical protein [Fluviicola sp.]|uniref:WD40/YVTN/BNR-like repeat-containing protein n=1 Tax=Fluviicola sp. TaxID=1917219 RepID=UPI0031D1BA67